MYGTLFMDCKHCTPCTLDLIPFFYTINPIPYTLYLLVNALFTLKLLEILLFGKVYFIFIQSNLTVLFPGFFHWVGISDVR